MCVIPEYHTFSETEGKEVLSAINSSFIGEHFKFKLKDQGDGRFELKTTVDNKNAFLTNIIGSLSNLKWAGSSVGDETATHQFYLEPGNKINIDDSPDKIKDALNNIRADIVNKGYKHVAESIQNYRDSVSQVDSFITNTIYAESIERKGNPEAEKLLDETRGVKVRQ